MECGLYNTKSVRLLPYDGDLYFLTSSVSPCRYHDIEIMFGVHALKLSEAFWKVFVHAYNKLHQLINTFRGGLIEDRAAVYTKCIEDAGGALNSCKGFIDQTKITITRPTGPSVMQRAFYRDVVHLPWKRIVDFNMEERSA